MNEKLTLLYSKKFIDSFSFQKKLLAWGISEAHLTKPVKNLLEEMIIDDALITR